MTNGFDPLGKGDWGKPLSHILATSLAAHAANGQLPHSIDTRRTGLSLASRLTRTLTHIKHRPGLADENLPKLLAEFLSTKRRFIMARKTRNPAAYIVTSFPKWLREHDELYAQPPRKD